MNTGRRVLIGIGVGALTGWGWWRTVRIGFDVLCTTGGLECLGVPMFGIPMALLAWGLIAGKLLSLAGFTRSTAVFAALVGGVAVLMTGFVRSGQVSVVSVAFAGGGELEVTLYASVIYGLSALLTAVPWRYLADREKDPGSGTDR